MTDTFSVTLCHGGAKGEQACIDCGNMYYPKDEGSESFCGRCKKKHDARDLL